MNEVTASLIFLLLLQYCRIENKESFLSFLCVIRDTCSGKDMNQDLPDFDSNLS